MLPYVYDGYVLTGYAEGDNPPLAERTPLKFFVSGGTKPEETLKTDVMNAVGVNDAVILYVPESKKIMFGGKNGLIEFLGGIDIETIIGSQMFIDAVKALTTINMTASIVASDGSVVVDTTVTQTADKTFEISIPNELVGTGFKIVLSDTIGL